MWGLGVGLPWPEAVLPQQGPEPVTTRAEVCSDEDGRTVPSRGRVPVDVQETGGLPRDRVWPM